MRKRVNSSRSRALSPYLGEDGRPGYLSRSTQTVYNPGAPSSPEWERAIVADYYKWRSHTAPCPYLDIMGAETINSTVGRKYNNVTHCRQRSISLPFWIQHHRYTNNSYTFYEPFYRFSGAGLLYDRDAVNRAIEHSHALGSHGDGFSARAYWSMRPRFAGEVSIINSIFELKDFKDALDLAPDLSRLYKRRRDLAKLAQPLLKFGNLASVTSKAAAAAVLAWNLAVKPTMSDFTAIAAQLSQHAQDRWQVFADYLSEGTTSHFSESAVYQNTIVPGTKNEYWHGSGKYLRVKRTATMTSYGFAKARSLNQICRDYYGFGAGPEEVWNMLPLSFVLDYILTFGKSLSYMKRADYYVLDKIEYQESTKVTATSGHHLIRSSLVPGLVVDGKVFTSATAGPKCLLVTGTEGTYYQRHQTEPYKGPALPRLKLPSGTQGLNMLALARCFI